MLLVSVIRVFCDPAFPVIQDDIIIFNEKESILHLWNMTAQGTSQKYK